MLSQRTDEYNIKTNKSVKKKSSLSENIQTFEVKIVNHEPVYVFFYFVDFIFNYLWVISFIYFVLMVLQKEIKLSIL